MNFTEWIEQLGIEPRQIELFEMALRHRSYRHEHPEVTTDNERLEFLGDAVMGFAVGEYLYQRYQEMSEGEMTSIRAALVRTETFADFARILKIDEQLLLGYGEGEYGGRTRAVNLAGAFEAVIGAIYLDLGIETVRKLIEPLIKPKLKLIIDQALHKDAKSELQIWSQAKMQLTPNYKVISEEGPDHAKTFIIQAWLGSELWGEGQGTSKQRAAQSAAAKALSKTEQFEMSKRAEE